MGWEDPLEKGTATHSSILAWRIPWGCKELDTTDFHDPDLFIFASIPIQKDVSNDVQLMSVLFISNRI